MPGGQRQVPVVALAAAPAALVRVAGVVREPARPRVHVQRSVPHVGPVIEDHLRAVAVVRVDVQHRHLGRPGHPERLGGDGGVVQVAGPAVAAAGRVVPGRPAQRVGQPGAGADQAGRGQRGIHRAADGGPAARPDQRHRVVAEQPGPGVHGRRHPERQPGQHRAGREQVRHHPVPAVIGGQPGLVPVRPDPGQVIDEPGIVHGAQDRVVVRARVQHRGARRFERGPEHQRPAGHLGARLPHAEPHLPRGLVPQAVRAPDDRDRHALPPVRGGVTIAGCRASPILASPSACCQRARPGRCSTCPGWAWATPPCGGTSRRRRPAGASPGPGSPCWIPAATCSRAPVPAGAAVLNGAGECTGLLTAQEWGLAESPVFLTSTMQLGRVYDAACELLIEEQPAIGSADVIIPIVAECDDSFLNDSRRMQVSAADVRQALAAARASVGGTAAEGAVGAGTGMSCLGYKGGIGTASRVLPERGHGRGAHADQLRRPGPAHRGRAARRPAAARPGPGGACSRDSQAGPAGSCIVVVITDGPLDAAACQRLARRAGLGLARTGSTADHGSGEIFLALATGLRAPRGQPPAGPPVTGRELDDYFAAVTEATEEAVLNSLLAGGDGDRPGRPHLRCSCPPATCAGLLTAVPR